MRVLVLLLACSTALADPVAKPADPVGAQTPWYKGPDAHNRFLHLTITGLLVAYGASNYFVHDLPRADSCRWCSPPGFDRGARHLFKWSDTELADSMSSVGAYIVAPVVGLTLLILSDRNASATRLIDDLLPVIETAAISTVTTGFAKYVFARERPYAYYGTRPIDTDSYSSFWSGHSNLGFSLTTAAGTVAHFRGYWTEPYIWAAGVTVSLGVEYLRMAADRHYLSDVFIGGGVGILAGALIPRLMSRDIKILPMPNGVQVVGALD